MCHLESLVRRLHDERNAAMQGMDNAVMHIITISAAREMFKGQGRWRADPKLRIHGGFRQFRANQKSQPKSCRLSILVLTLTTTYGVRRNDRAPLGEAPKSTEGRVGVGVTRFG